MMSALDTHLYNFGYKTYCLLKYVRLLMNKVPFLENENNETIKLVPLTVMDPRGESPL